MTTAAEGAQLHEALKAALTAGVTNNTAPTETVGAVVIENDERVLARMTWGFKLPGKPPLINGRAETLLEKSAFASHARERRCLVPANGFYEWRDEGGKKQPYLVCRRDRQVMAFAGIYRPSHELVIVTCEPNELIQPIHDRMVAIIDPADYDLWLSGAAEDAVKAAAVPYPADQLEMYPVTRAMGNPRYKLEDAHEPLKDLFNLD